MTWPRLVVAAVAIMVGAAGCGSASKSPTTQGAGTTTGLTTTSGPAQDIAADKAAADAASLKLTDFPPGWTSTPSSSGPDVPNVDTELTKCLGVSRADFPKSSPAKSESPDFSDSNNNTVSSAVGYQPEASRVQRALALFSDPKAPACLTTAVASIIDYSIHHPAKPSDTLPSGVTVGSATVAQMSFPAYGDKDAAYRVTVPVSIKSLTISFYLDLIVVGKGRADVEMFFQGIGTPFDTTSAQHYTGLVVDRLTNT
jgi:hypothetical protein